MFVVEPTWAQRIPSTRHILPQRADVLADCLLRLAHESVYPCRRWDVNIAHKVVREMPGVIGDRAHELALCR